MADQQPPFGGAQQQPPEGPGGAGRLGGPAQQPEVPPRGAGLIGGPAQQPEAPPGGPGAVGGPGGQQQVNLGPDQFAQMMMQAIDRLRPLQINNNQVGGGVVQPGNQGGQLKPPRLESLDPESFLVWKRNFQDVAALNNWEVARAKLMARASLFGDAAAACHTIALGGEERPLAELLDAYENRILTPAASTMAESLFEQAAQLPGESVNKFHSRLRSLFVRAYPDLLPQLETRRELIKRFLAGLSNGQIRLHAKSHNPLTYTAACEHASQYEAVLLSEKQPGGGRGHPGVHQMHAANPAPPTVANITTKPEIVNAAFGHSAGCQFCGKDNHEASTCYALANLRQVLDRYPKSTISAKDNARKKKPGKGRSSNSQPRPAVHAIAPANSAPASMNLEPSGN